jgi:hypothetical protein
MAKGAILLYALAAGALGSTLRAQDVPSFKVGGFGTLAAVQSSEKRADFTSNYSQPNGPGFTRSVDFGVDSKLGLQADARFTEWLSAVAQVVSDRRYDATFKPYLAMADLKFQVSSNLYARAGRMPFSAYLISDYKKVGYSTPWVRPPVEVYQFNPLTSYDGADVTFQHRIGGVALTWQVAGGSSSVDLPQAEAQTKFKGRDMGGLSVAAVVGASSFRAYYLRFKGTLDSPTLDAPGGAFDLLRTLPPAFGGNPALAEQFQLKGKVITYLSVGYSYDPGDWFLMAEGARNAGDETILLQATSGYVTAGVRLGAWTPFVTAGSKRTDSPTTNANPIVNAMVSANNQAQSSVSCGVRWDFWKNMDLKLQYDHVKNGAGSGGVLINPQQGFETGKTYDLASVAIDFVF